MAKRFLVSILLFLALVGMGWQSGLAQSGGEEYFEETRHWVRGEFLTKFHEVTNPIEIYGYPITSAFLDPKTNLVVQYFEKARFELHPDAPEGQRVQVSSLGDYLYVKGEPVPNADHSPSCRVFSNGLKVCYEFLKFFDDNGGIARFGLPLSNLEFRNGMIVQYFQNARFEWHSELPSGKRVLLGGLGWEYFYRINEDRSLLKPEPGDNTAETKPEGLQPQVGVLALKARAYPLKAVTSRDGRQTIYVIIQDQSLLPVKGVDVTLKVRMPSGEEQLYAVNDRTDDNGVTSYTFPFTSDVVGNVLITVEATRTPLKAKTTTSFRIWW